MSLAAPEQWRLTSRTKGHLLPHLTTVSHTHTHTGLSRIFQNSDGTLWTSEVVGHLCEVEKPGGNITASLIHKAIFIQPSCSSLSCLFSSLYPVSVSISTNYSQPPVSKSRNNIMPNFSALRSLYTLLVNRSHPTESSL